MRLRESLCFESTPPRSQLVRCTASVSESAPNHPDRFTTHVMHPNLRRWFRDE